MNYSLMVATNPLLSSLPKTTQCGCCTTSLSNLLSTTLKPSYSVSLCQPKTLSKTKHNMEQVVDPEGGVFGIFGDPEATRMFYLALQHRGTGISTINNGILNFLAGAGLEESKLDILPGEISIGVIGNSQPFNAVYGFGYVGVAHTGNFTNYQSLKTMLEQKASFFNISSNTEVVLYLIALSISETKPLFLRILDACEQLRGDFSMVFIFEDKMIAVRDPHGFRPLLMGQKKSNGAIVFASEMSVFDLIGATFDRDVKPGEILYVTRQQGVP